LRGNGQRISFGFYWFTCAGMMARHLSGTMMILAIILTKQHIQSKSTQKMTKQEVKMETSALGSQK
jgi:flagellar biosynthesis protein FlhB